MKQSIEERLKKLEEDMIWWKKAHIKLQEQVIRYHTQGGKSK